MKRILYLTVLFALFLVPCSGQTKKARKIADLTMFHCEYLKALSFNFQTEINEEADSEGYIIVYEGKDETSVYNKNGKFDKYKYISPLRGQLNRRIRHIQGMLHFINAPLERIKIHKWRFS